MNICEIGVDRFEECAPLLHDLNPRMTDPQWKLLFRSPWTDRAPGIALEVDGAIHGMMLLITAMREIEGKMLTVCAPSTWVVAPDYRQYSLALLQAMVDTGDDLIITHTLSDVAYRIFKRFDFVDFEDSKLFVLPGIGREYFESYDNQLVRDHALPGCIALAAGHHELILKRIRKIKKGVGVTSFEVLYANRPLDNRILKRLASHLLFKHFAAGVFVDSRFTEGDVQGFRFPNKKLYRGTLQAPQKLDNLYSELVLLNRGYP